MTDLQIVWRNPNPPVRVSVEELRSINVWEWLTFCGHPEDKKETEEK